mgnify:FL=1
MNMQCFKCETEMKKVKFIGNAAGMPSYLAYKEKGVFNPEIRDNVECYVCPKCGYIELKAENPSLFKNLTNLS